MNHAAPAPDFLVVHTSDVHVDDDYAAAQFAGDGTRYLRAVVAAARSACADVLLLVGDTFDHNRLPGRVLERAAAVLAEFQGSIVALPGNHDPATADCAFRHPALAALPHLRTLGVNADESIVFPSFGLEIWGRPHRDFGDMDPFGATPPRAQARWRIALGHGHYEPAPDRQAWPRPGWLFGDADLAASQADYVALGHWNRRAQVGLTTESGAEAWYSGSPDVARSVNLCKFSATSAPAVAALKLEL